MAVKQKTSRVKAVVPANAQGDVKHLYANIQRSMGGHIPNIFQIMGNSVAALKGFLALSEAVNETSLHPHMRSQISLIVAQTNDCQYCLSAHTMIAGNMGLKSDQIMQARRGEAKDPKAKALLNFVKQVVEKRGQVSDQEVNALKKMGVSDQELVEVMLAITLNMFTNYFNNVMGTEIDFPEAPELR